MGSGGWGVVLVEGRKGHRKAHRKEQKIVIENLIHKLFN